LNNAYNGLGQHRSKQVNSKLTAFRYGLNGELLAEIGTGGTSFKEYIYLDGQPLAMLTSTLPGDDGPGLVLTTTPARKGSSIGFAWSGIEAPTASDWVGVYAVEASEYDYLDWAYTAGQANGTLSLTLGHPSLVPGQQYELRLYANDGYARLATSAPFTLDPTGPTVIAASTPAQLGTSLQIAWSGITNPTPSDWVGLYVARRTMTTLHQRGQQRHGPIEPEPPCPRAWRQLRGAPVRQ
jgi:hypothetical protein